MKKINIKHVLLCLGLFAFLANPAGALASESSSENSVLICSDMQDALKNLGVFPKKKSDEGEKKEAVKEEPKGKRPLKKTKTDRTAKEKKRENLIKGATNIFASTRKMDYKSEFTIGESLSLEGFGRYGLPVKNDGLQKYVNLLGSSLAKYSDRSEIPYYFVVVESNVYNAFACPGGIIFLSSALVKSMRDESELAAVLAHEIAHVSHKHALTTIQRSKLLKGVGQISSAAMKKDKGKSFQNVINGLESVLFEKGLDKNMEYQADASGMEIMYRTGYDPAALIRVLATLRSKEKSATKAGSWFSTHPPLSSRISKCGQILKKYPDAKSMSRGAARFKKYQKSLFTKKGK